MHQTIKLAEEEESLQVRVSRKEVCFVARMKPFTQKHQSERLIFYLMGCTVAILKVLLNCERAELLLLVFSGKYYIRTLGPSCASLWRRTECGSVQHFFCFFSLHLFHLLFFSSFLPFTSLFFWNFSSFVFYHHRQKGSNSAESRIASTQRSFFPTTLSFRHLH